jgi:alpha-glucosidase
MKANEIKEEGNLAGKAAETDAIGDATGGSTIPDMTWWKTGIIYQVYPRSFKDSNYDGIGDLQGIISKLDYLEWLGITAIWLTPVYPSPMADFGYDISDYTGIHTLFGTLDDFERLLEEVHRRHMKLIMDLVPNHSSDQHPWFVASRSSKENAKRDWYLWQDAAPGGSPPNNWLAAFGGTAWEWDEHTGQYYMHSFLKEQPDLNWRNPEVMAAMADVMRFWLDKGVDGFRVDVMWHLIKDQQLRDNPVNPQYKPHMATYDQLLPVYSTDQPEVHDIVEQMRAVLDEYDDRVMIGEIYLPVNRLVSYYGRDSKGAQLPFNFQLIFLPWSATEIAAAIDAYEGALPVDGWPNWVTGNHDQVRIASRIGLQQARVAAMLLLTLRGTPTLYYGEEIGMTDVPIPLAEIQDPMGRNMPGKYLSRDPARTPMQWDTTAHGGFSEADPWLRTGSGYIRNNVQQQQDDPYAMLSLYRKLIRLRQRKAALHSGQYIPVSADEQYLAFKRVWPGEKTMLVILNLTHRPCYFNMAGPVSGVIVAAVSPELEGVPFEGSMDMAGDEGVIIEIFE